MTAVDERSPQVGGGPRLDVRALVRLYRACLRAELARGSSRWPRTTRGAARHRLANPSSGAAGTGGGGAGGPAWTMGGPGVRDLGPAVVRWRVPVRWWLVAVSPALFLGLALIVMAVAGKTLPRAADFGLFSGIPAIGLFGVLLLIFVGALGEETGWRGYALPQLQRRFSPLTSSLILAVVWFGWHLPQFWVIGTYRDFAPASTSACSSGWRAARSC